MIDGGHLGVFISRLQFFVTRLPPPPFLKGASDSNKPSGKRLPQPLGKGCGGGLLNVEVMVQGEDHMLVHPPCMLGLRIWYRFLRGLQTFF